MKINHRLSIPYDELWLRASRSSGPGGQNVNKVSTRVTLFFDVLHSPSLSEDERGLILQSLGNRINKGGILMVTSQESRSQADNRETVLKRFSDILRNALRVPPQRKQSSVSSSAKHRRLQEKRHRGLLKQERSLKPTLDT
ncbi:MAG: aminoacyl-tRNA hydrolase [Deltaproteobacteria bacterium]|nr:aminoacyl-tRNA hydrolase [Deltaproteobacteria bacterium]